MEDERTTVINDRPVEDGTYVLYWMQQSQRADCNPALEHAIRRANELGQACVVGFGLMEDYPEAQERHFAFMLEGLAETAEKLADRGLKLVVNKGEPWRVAVELGREASQVICDVGYLRHQRTWRRNLRRHLQKPIVAVEGDLIVPLRTASEKAEWAARTLRPKIHRQLDRFLREPSQVTPDKSSLPLRLVGEIDVRSPAEELLSSLRIPRDVPKSRHFRGGASQARGRLTRFLRSGLDGYAGARNDPADPCASELSPYLHFGQISPLEIALKVLRAKSGSDADKEAFLEELVVRRELAANFVAYTDRYDSYLGLPEWARRTLAEHEEDERPYRYTRAELERAATHDPYWNAAMREARLTGYMHNYMRMYWGKKILEWTGTPEYAYSTTLYLNNKYFLDGRDPSSYANVGWLFGLHDRGWSEREVFGKVRYMNAAGLERKFDIEAYVDRVNRLESTLGS